MIALLEEHLAATQSGENHVVITVVGRDRVGIIARVAQTLAEAQVNILDINQTLFRQLFTMNMVVDISRATCSFAQLQENLTKVGEELGVKIYAQREEVFHFMHRV